ncbi:hypothetical protein BDV41DRAFT_573754 [Aspergillus transmontanensis]|uniref:Uncharacterized protein n=1 Tax=Aspergillus transmontanensis TaxID=1034304 RepID=A0A5N6WAM0_9EURO|nr:hypothetical protein BDV41DRAFT_573754 [Aspergillus transmontanensis]
MSVSRPVGPLIGISDPECLIWWGIPVPPNPDISGIGVVLGFLLAAWTTLLVLIFHYVAVHPSPRTSPGHQRNDLDCFLQDGTRRALKWTPSSHWGPPLETLILGMSDQQLVTGLAIMTSGYAQIQDGLSTSHWNIITSLAWFSSIIHIATLPYLASYFTKKRWLWYIRVTLMSGLAIMLTIGLTAMGKVTGYLKDMSMPISCYFNAGLDALVNNPAQVFIMLVSEILVLGGLMTRLVQMSPTTTDFSRSLSRSLEDLWIKGLVWACARLESSSTFVQSIFFPLVAFSLSILCLVRCLLQFLGSAICGLLWLLFSLVWGTIRLSRARDNHVSEENSWAFEVLEVDEGQPNSTNNTMQLGQYLTTTDPPRNALQGISANNPSLPTRCDTIQSPTDSISSQLIQLCKTDIRTTTWHLSILCFIPIIMIGVISATIALIFPPPAAIELPEGDMDMSTDGILLDSLVAPAISVFIALASLLPIPWCWVIDSLDPAPLSQRHRMSVIRLAIDPGKTYVRARLIFFVCFLIMSITCPIFWIQYYMIPLGLFAALWGGVAVPFVCSALAFGVFHIVRRVSSTNNV